MAESASSDRQPADLRSRYMRAGLEESDLDPDPTRQFERWYAEARNAGVATLDAVTVATATPDGKPSARLVLHKGVDDRGFTFDSTSGSRKARELAENPYAALVFYWHEQGRQVRVEGRVERVSQAESEAYFATRPVGSRLSAWASFQSEVIESRAVLERRIEDLLAAYGQRDLPLPPYWGGFP